MSTDSRTRVSIDLHKEVLKKIMRAAKKEKTPMPRKVYIERFLTEAFSQKGGLR